MIYGLKEYEVTYINRYGETVGRVVWSKSEAEAQKAWEGSQYAQGAQLVGVLLINQLPTGEQE